MLTPCLLRDSHLPDSRGAKGGRGAGRDIRVVLGVQFVLNSVLERDKTDVRSATGLKRAARNPGKMIQRKNHLAKTTARSAPTRAPSPAADAQCAPNAPSPADTLSKRVDLLFKRS